MSCTTYISFFLGGTIQLINAAVLVSVSSNPLERSQFSFSKGREWQKGQNIIVQSNGRESLI